MHINREDKCTVLPAPPSCKHVPDFRNYNHCYMSSSDMYLPALFAAASNLILHVAKSALTFSAPALPKHWSSIRPTQGHSAALSKTMPNNPSNSTEFRKNSDQVSRK